MIFSNIDHNHDRFYEVSSHISGFKFKLEFVWDFKEVPPEGNLPPQLFFTWSATTQFFNQLSISIY
jgi:hypothetical protein